MFKPRNTAIIVLSLLGIITLAACSKQEVGADIKDITWQWAALVENQPAAQSVVPDPENYTLLLNADGTLSIQADCNMVGGSYTVDGDSLTLELGPSTMAYCGEQSLDTMFLELLTNVESYTIESDQLVLSLQNDAGEMTFNK
jgi:heat shock protein HslJ